MVHKRKRNPSAHPKGLVPGAILKHLKTADSQSLSSPWGWVGHEVTNPAAISLDHRLSTCGFSQRNKNPRCANKFSEKSNLEDDTKARSPNASDSNKLGEDEIIVISDDETPSCSKKLCKANPYCLNYLGQEKWTDEDKAKEVFMAAADLGFDPSDESREEGLPVGLKNLGATCYANASLQVWYRDLEFRRGVYLCKPPEGMSDAKYQDSPIFQLQTTFAALQTGNIRAFNPSRLVESLQLSTVEQQDAQEFSKLFMSHLDAEFKKQALPSLKSLVTDQFQGGLVYGTRCHACDNRSERSADFLELEINFTSHCKLEDRIKATLAPETLSGDNQYLCSHCDSLQDATRYTHLKTLPPVLHFSLMRFVYDISSMERKKSKHSITFPTLLDMTPFITESETGEQDVASGVSSSHIYELRGVLLHKGASAYHGHYEAQIKDPTSNTWFLFNDEIVTKIKSLNSKPAPQDVITIDDADEPASASQVKKDRANARKRRRIADSDDEPHTKAKSQAPPTPAKTISSSTSSKDAYMLIYAKRDRPSDVAEAPTPPPAATELVQKLNAEHDSLCHQYKIRKDELDSLFTNTRAKMMNIFQSWVSPQTIDGTVVVSQHAIKTWVDEKSFQTPLGGNGADTSRKEGRDRTSDPAGGDNADSSADHASGPTPTPIPNTDVLCEHGALDPVKSLEMKCISQDAYNLIVSETNCTFEPVLHPVDVCTQCTETLFREKLYEFEHPRLVKQFEEVSNPDDDDVGYWISKKWCRDWRLNKPRMHSESLGDPAPDTEDFREHVLCEHNNLTTNSLSRRRITRDAMLLLKKLFPSWDPPSTESEPCALCSSAVHLSKEDKKEIRKRVEDEKALLRFLSETLLDSWRVHAKEVQDYAILYTGFVKQWKRWLNAPNDNPRPERVDNSPFFCEHDNLILDPNCPNDLDQALILRRSDWDTLVALYGGGPAIILTKEASEGRGDKYSHETPVCWECRTKSKTDWEVAEIVVRLGVAKGTPEGNPTSTTTATSGAKKEQQPSAATAPNGIRSSKRLRQIKEHGERRRLTVSKATTVKEIKIMVQREFSVPTICQRLFHNGVELDDNSCTVEALCLLANDVLDLKEAEEILSIDDTDSEDGPRPAKKRKEEGRAFVGTLLGNSDAWSSSPEQTPMPSSQPPQVESAQDAQKACSKCTFVNPPGAATCEMCEFPFV